VLLFLSLDIVFAQIQTDDNRSLGDVARKTRDQTRSTQSAKLGITSVNLLVSTLVPPFFNWRHPIAFVSLGLSGPFALLAASQGSKWLLTIPGIILTGLRSYSILASIRFDNECNGRLLTAILLDWEITTPTPVCIDSILGFQPTK
jgi:hypothetical protein